MVPHRFRRFFDSLSADDRKLARAQGISSKDRPKKTKTTTKPVASRKPSRLTAVKTAGAKKMHTRTKKADS